MPGPTAADVPAGLDFYSLEAGGELSTLSRDEVVERDWVVNHLIHHSSDVELIPAGFTHVNH